MATTVEAIARLVWESRDDTGPGTASVRDNITKTAAAATAATNGSADALAKMAAVSQGASEKELSFWDLKRKAADDARNALGEVALALSKEGEATKEGVALATEKKAAYDELAAAQRDASAMITQSQEKELSFWELQKTALSQLKTAQGELNLAVASGADDYTTLERSVGIAQARVDLLAAAQIKVAESFAASVPVAATFGTELAAANSRAALSLNELAAAILRGDANLEAFSLKAQLSKDEVDGLTASYKEAAAMITTATAQEVSASDLASAATKRQRDATLALALAIKEERVELSAEIEELRAATVEREAWAQAQLDAAALAKGSNALTGAIGVPPSIGPVKTTDGKAFANDLAAAQARATETTNALAAAMARGDAGIATYELEAQRAGKALTALTEIQDIAAVSAGTGGRTVKTAAGEWIVLGNSARLADQGLTGWNASMILSKGNVALLAAAIGVLSLREMAHLQTQFADFAGLTGTFGAQLDYIKQKSLELAREGPIGVDDIVQAYRHASDEGYRHAQATEVVNAAWKGAIATGSSLDSTANALSTAMSNFHEPASNASKDMALMVLAMQSGNETLDQMTSGLSKLSAIGSAIGMPLNQVLALQSALTRATGSAATSQVWSENILVHIENPTKQALTVMEELRQKTGVDLAQAFEAFSHHQMSFKSLMDEVTVATKNDNGAMLALFGGMRGGIGALALRNGITSQYSQELNKQADAQRNVNKADAEHKDSIGYKVEQGKNIGEQALNFLGLAANKSIDMDILTVQKWGQAWGWSTDQINKAELALNPLNAAVVAEQQQEERSTAAVKRHTEQLIALWKAKQLAYSPNDSPPPGVYVPPTDKQVTGWQTKITSTYQNDAQRVAYDQLNANVPSKIRQQDEANLKRSTAAYEQLEKKLNDLAQPLDIFKSGLKTAGLDEQQQKQKELTAAEGRAANEFFKTGSILPATQAKIVELSGGLTKFQKLITDLTSASDPLTRAQNAQSSAVKAAENDFLTLGYILPQHAAKVTATSARLDGMQKALASLTASIDPLTKLQNDQSTAVKAAQADFSQLGYVMPSHIEAVVRTTDRLNAMQTALANITANAEYEKYGKAQQGATNDISEIQHQSTLLGENNNLTSQQIAVGQARLKIEQDTKQIELDRLKVTQLQHEHGSKAAIAAAQATVNNDINTLGEDKVGLTNAKAAEHQQQTNDHFALLENAQTQQIGQLQHQSALIGLSTTLTADQKAVLQTGLQVQIDQRQIALDQLKLAQVLATPHHTQADVAAATGQVNLDQGKLQEDSASHKQALAVSAATDATQKFAKQQQDAGTKATEAMSKLTLGILHGDPPAQIAKLTAAAISAAGTVTMLGTAAAKAAQDVAMNSGPIAGRVAAAQADLATQTDLVAQRMYDLHHGISTKGIPSFATLYANIDKDNSAINGYSAATGQATRAILDNEAAALGLTGAFKTLWETVAKGGPIPGLAGFGNTAGASHVFAGGVTGGALITAAASGDTEASNLKISNTTATNIGLELQKSLAGGNLALSPTDRKILQDILQEQIDQNNIDIAKEKQKQVDADPNSTGSQKQDAANAVTVAINAAKTDHQQTLTDEATPAFQRLTESVDQAHDAYLNGTGSMNDYVKLLGELNVATKARTQAEWNATFAAGSQSTQSQMLNSLVQPLISAQSSQASSDATVANARLAVIAANSAITVQEIQAQTTALQDLGGELSAQTGVGTAQFSMQLARINDASALQSAIAQDTATQKATLLTIAADQKAGDSAKLSLDQQLLASQRKEGQDAIAIAQLTQQMDQAVGQAQLRIAQDGLKTAHDKMAVDAANDAANAKVLQDQLKVALDNQKLAIDNQTLQKDTMVILDDIDLSLGGVGDYVDRVNKDLASITGDQQQATKDQGILGGDQNSAAQIAAQGNYALGQDAYQTTVDQSAATNLQQLYELQIAEKKAQAAGDNQTTQAIQAAIQALSANTNALKNSGDTSGVDELVKALRDLLARQRGSGGPTMRGNSANAQMNSIASQGRGTVSAH